MKKLQLVAHPADVCIKATGTSLDDIFSASLEGLCSILIRDFDTQNFEQKEQFELTVNSDDLECLLVEFLSESLRIMHTHKVILIDSTFEYIKQNSLKATLIAAEIEEFDEDVKAVTYYQAKVEFLENSYFISKITLDI